MPVVRTAGQAHAELQRLSLGADHLLTHGQPLHTAVGGDPLATGHVAVANINLERQTQTLGLLRGKDERLPPMGVEHLVGTLAVAVHLVVVDNTAHTGLTEGFQVGRDTLAGGFRLTEEPPHLGAGRVLRMVEAVGK